MSLTFKQIYDYGYDVLELYHILNTLRYEYKYKEFNLFEEEKSYGALSLTCEFTNHMIKCLIDNFYNEPTWNAVLSDFKKNIQKYAKDEKVIITYLPTTPTPIDGKFKYVIDTKHYKLDLDLLSLKVPKGYTNVHISEINDNNIIVKCNSDETIKGPITISTVADVKI